MEYIPCLLCGRSNCLSVSQTIDRKTVSPSVFTVVMCLECGFIYLNPRPDKFEIRNFYPDTYGPWLTSQSWRPSRQWYLRKALIYLTSYLYYGTPPGEKLVENLATCPEFLRKIIKTIIYPLSGRLGPLPVYRMPGRLLEVGCGTGGYLDLVQDLGWRTYGIEIGLQPAAVARENGHEVIIGTLQDSPWEDQYFQAACFWHSLEHLHDPCQALDIIFRLLSPKAELLIEVPNWDSIGRNIYQEDWFALELPRHLSFYTTRSLCEIVTGAGFMIKNIKTLPSRFVLQKSQKYFEETHQDSNRRDDSQFAWQKYANWRVIALVEKLINRGEVIRVYAIRP
jgi:SAM-dependent methyltransferase